MPIRYNIVRDDGVPSSITVFPATGAPLVATKENPNFDSIIRGINDARNEEEVIGMFDMEVGLNTKFNKVSDRVSIRHAKVYFDNMVVNNVLTDTIVKFHAAGSDDFMSLVNFMEKIEQNPNPNSKENLFRWLKSGRFSITPDGDIIGYKAVNRKSGVGVVRRGDAPDEYLSTRSGPAIVDGVPQSTGHVPNNPGVIVEMARNEVTFDPHQTCSQGLHVADWSYAGPSGPMSGSVVLMVLVNPRDVVSVPVDYNDHKMRVCRYKVLKAVTAEETALLHVDAALHTLTSRMTEWMPGAVAPIKKASTPRKAVKKAATAVKKAVAKKTTTPKAAVKKAVPVKAGAKAKKETPAKSTVTKASTKLPKHYEEFTQQQFQTLPYTKLQWIAKQWELTVKGARTAAAYEVALAAEAKKRLAKAGRRTSSK